MNDIKSHLTSAANTGIGVEKSCDIRDLPVSEGSTIVTGLGKEFTPLPAVVMLVDIVGFGKLMQQSSTAGLAFESAIFFKSCLDEFAPAGFSAEEIDHWKRKFMRISDTIAMWFHTCGSKVGPSQLELEERGLRWMTEAGRHLLRMAYSRKRWILRGAISFGEAIQDATDSAILGKPWAEAAALEKAQEWSGISLHHSAAGILTENLKGAGLVTKWPVPCNGGKSDLWVVDWRDRSVTKDHVRQTFSLLGEGDQRANRKLQNTLSFLN